MPKVEAEPHMASMSVPARSTTQMAKIAVAGQHALRVNLSVLTVPAMQIVPVEMEPRTVHVCLGAMPLPVKPAVMHSHAVADNLIRGTESRCPHEGRVLNVRLVYRTPRASVRRKPRASVRRKRRVIAVMNLRVRMGVQHRMAHVLWRVLADIPVANAIQAIA
jgi:hypothetical protein